MINQEYTRKNIFWNYYDIRSSLENDLRNIHIDTKKIFSENLQDIILRLQLSFEKNQEQIEQSMDKLYFDMRTAFKNVFNCSGSNSTGKNNEKINYVVVHSGCETNHKIKNEKKHFEIEDACIVEDTVKNKSSYTFLVNKIIYSSDKIVNDVATVMAGKLCNSYGIKDRKPKRLWKWEDRIDYLRGYLKENKISDSEKEQINELRSALQKNRYLRSKRKDCYKRIDDCLAQYYFKR
jgi:hypothetical protein